MQLCIVNTLGRRLPVSSRAAAVLAELLLRKSGADDDRDNSPSDELRARLLSALASDANLLGWIAERADIDADDVAAAVDWLYAQPANTFVDVFTIDGAAPDDSPDSAPDELVSQATESMSLAMCLPKLAARLARLDDLEHRFNETLEEEKLEAMAELAAGAGHEINNPLAVISGRAQLFLRQEDNPERRRAFASMNTQVGRVFEMISDLMLYARPPQPQTEEVALVEIVDQVIADLAAVATERGITLRRDDAEMNSTQDNVTLTADRTQLIVAVRAVVENALNELDHNGRIDISLSRSAESGEARIAIRDNGPGISAEVRRHLFDPFYSGRQAGRGLGMGLAKCWRIVTNHGGRVDVDSEEGYGTTLTICLPLRLNASTDVRAS